MRRVHVAIASSAGFPAEFPELRLLVAALREHDVSASVAAWDDPEVDWSAFDMVVIRATWDYPGREDEFLAWVDALGERVHNRPAVVRWNADKQYLRDLAAAGLPVIDTLYVAPGDPVPRLRGEVVVKPTVSAGARDTGRFGPGAHPAARALIQALSEKGRTAMVQPYLAAVDSVGETAVVLIDGAVSHVLHKRAVLAPDEIAPTRDDELGAAEAMYDPDLVKAHTATEQELALADAVAAELVRRFGEVPLYARVDMVPGPDGSPVLLELEAVEPSLYHDQAPHSATTLAHAIKRRSSDRGDQPRPAPR